MPTFDEKSLNAPRNRTAVRRSPVQWLGHLLLLALVGLPVGWTAAYAAVYSCGGAGHFSSGWTWQHWRLGYGSGGLTASLAFSLATATVIVSLATVAALAFVLAAHDLRADRRLLALLCLPLGTPAAVTALLVYQLLNPGGLLARLMFHAGWLTTPSDFPALVNDRWAVGIVIAGTYSTFPLLALFFLRTWTSAHVDRYCQLASALGAGLWYSRLRIAVPMLLRRGWPLILLLLLLNLGSYEIPLLLGRQSPQMISVLIQQRSGQFDLQQRPQAFVFATTYLVIAAASVTCLLWRRRPHA